MAYKELNYRDFITEKFQEYRMVDSSFSMRKFAKVIGLTPSNLSDILKRRCGLSTTVASKVAELLDLKDYDRNLFIDLVESEHARSLADRKAAQKRLAGREKSSFYPRFTTVERSVIEKWYYTATLELLNVLDGHFNEGVFLKRLALSKEQLREALESLVDHGVIVKKGDRYHRAQNYVFAQSAVSSKTIVSFHRQFIAVAQAALDQPIPERKFLSTMMPFDSRRTAEAREFLEKVDRDFFERFQSPETADSVFGLGLQLFRIDKKGTK